VLWEPHHWGKSSSNLARFEPGERAWGGAVCGRTVARVVGDDEKADFIGRPPAFAVHDHTSSLTTVPTPSAHTQRQDKGRHT